MPDIIYNYEPHPRQQVAHKTIVDEMMYGGAKGGGKSRLARAEAVKLALQVPGSRSIIMRQSFKDLHRAVETHMLKEIPRELATYNKQDHEFVFTNGSVIELGYLSKTADLDNYQGAEYQLCVEKNTPVLMGDGTWKPIREIRAGDMVSTLQGPRRVTATHNMGKKPVARVTTPHGSAVVSMDHNLLTPTAWVAPRELLASQSRDERGPSLSSSGTCPAGVTRSGYSPSDLGPACSPQQPHPAGTHHQETPEWSTDVGTGYEVSDDSHPEAEQLPQWTGHLMLYGPCPHQEVSGYGPTNEEQGGLNQTSAAGSHSGCHPSSRSRDARAPVSPAEAETQVLPPSPDGAVASVHLSGQMGDQPRTPSCNHSGLFGYNHPYTTERIQSSEAAHRASAQMDPAGEAEVLDLTVEGSNHYVTWGQLIAQNCIFEEGTQFTQEMYTFMRAQLRVAGPVKDRLDELGLRPRSIITANPGGIGHHWVKQRFVDPAPAGKVFRIRPTDEDPNPRTRVFIPAKVDDNPSLGYDYVNNLRQLSPEKQRAYLDGDWDIIEGVRFSQWRASRHVVNPDQIPISGLTGRRVIAVDYGFNAPFAAVWLAELHDGMVVQYRELYETELTARQQAELIAELSQAEDELTGTVAPVVMDPSMWRRQDASLAKPVDPNTPPPGSPAHTYQSVLGRTPIRAINNRPHGWNQLDEKLTIRDDGFPRYLVYETCRDTIRTIPALPRDRKNPDDVDTSADDHLADALRYGLMWLASNSFDPRGNQAPATSRKPAPGLTQAISVDRF